MADVVTRACELCGQSTNAAFVLRVEHPVPIGEYREHPVCSALCAYRLGMKHMAAYAAQTVGQSASFAKERHPHG